MSRLGVPFFCLLILGIQADCPVDVSEWADFIVVGCGTGGSVVAARLAALNAKVLVLEEGNEAEIRDLGLIGMPRFAYALWGIPTVTREVEATPGSKETLVHSLRNGLRGLGRGGSSNINAALWSRPPLSEFDDWGITGWRGSDVAPFYRRVESWQGDLQNGYHGDSGPVNLEAGPTPLYAPSWLNDAELGYPDVVVDRTNGDINGKLAYVYHAIKDGTRQDAYTSYILPIQATASNLCILTGAVVTKVNVDRVRNMKRASGVTYTHNGVAKSASAEKEVILSAGVYGTSKILLLSGIGPRQDLNRQGIFVEADLPVGFNFTSRAASWVIMSGLAALSNPAAVIADYMRNEILDFTSSLGAAAYGQWLTTHTGPLTQPIASVFGSPIFTQGGPLPPYLIEYVDTAPPQFPSEYIQQCPPFGNPASIPQFPPQTPPGLNMGICILRNPKSRSHIKLRSPNPNDPIDYSPNFFDSDQDVQDMIQCIEKLRGPIGADQQPPPGGIFGVSVHPETYGPTEFAQYRGIEVLPGIGTPLPNYVKACSSSAYHVYGSTVIGTSSRTSVVDPKLLVYGFENLRIADTGVIPNLSTGPMATTYMIGERCAEFIKTKHQL